MIADMEKTIVRVSKALLTGLIDAATAFRDGLKTALDSIDQNHAAYDDLKAQYDAAQAKIAELEATNADEENLADEPDLSNQVNDLIASAQSGGDSTGTTGTDTGGDTSAGTGTDGGTGESGTGTGTGQAGGQAEPPNT